MQPQPLSPPPVDPCRAVGSSGHPPSTRLTTTLAALTSADAAPKPLDPCLQQIAIFVAAARPLPLWRGVGHALPRLLVETPITPTTPARNRQARMAISAARLSAP